MAREEICDLLRAFISDENKSVLFSTHIASDLEKIADYITFILNGNIVFTGTKDDLLDRYVRVTGGLSDLNNELKKAIIGYREYGADNYPKRLRLKGNLVYDTDSVYRFQHCFSPSTTHLF